VDTRGYRQSADSVLVVNTDERQPALFLGVLAIVLLSAYLIFSILVPQTPARMGRPSALLIGRFSLWAVVTPIELDMLHSREGVAALLILSTGIAFGAYALAIYVSWHYQGHSASLSVAILAIILFSIVVLVALPTFDSDIYNYMISGRVGAVYDRNPHYVPPDRFPHDPIYQYASRQYTRIPGDNKLPAWTVVNIFLASLGGDSVLANLFVYRAALLAFHVANLGLIAAILHRLNPSHLLTGLIVYAWNPIVVLRAQSKADTVMVFFLLLAIFWLVSTAYHRLAIIPLTLSVLVKLITLPLLAVVILSEIRRRNWRQVIVSLGLVGVTVVIVYLPFIRGPDLLISHMKLLGKSGSAAPDDLKPVLVALFALLIAGIGLTRRDDRVDLLRGWALVLLFFALFLTRLTLSWYLITLIAVVSLIRDGRIVMLAVTLSFSSFLLNAWNATSNKVFRLPDIATPRLVVYLALPVLSVLLVIAWQARHRVHVPSAQPGKD
jgi:hypothetical protein